MNINDYNLEQLVSYLKCVECNDNYKDLIKNIGKDNFIYKELQEKKELFSKDSKAFFYYYIELHDNLEREILSILKEIY